MIDGETNIDEARKYEDEDESMGKKLEVTVHQPLSKHCSSSASFSECPEKKKINWQTEAICVNAWMKMGY